MKRRNFFGKIGLAAAAMAVPSLVKAQDEKQFAHDPLDYAQVQEEPYEFDELDVDLSDDWFKMDIVWE